MLTVETKMSWNEENVARLRELWDQGLPTAQIGKLIGFTKNAVVGKAHRIGLERRPSPIRRTAVKPDRKKARSPVMPKLNFETSKEIICYTFQLKYLDLIPINYLKVKFTLGETKERALSNHPTYKTNS